MVAVSSEFIEAVETAVRTNDLAALEHMANEYFEPADHGPQPFSPAVALTTEGWLRVISGPDRHLSQAQTEGFWGDLGLAAANLVERGRRQVKYNLRLLSDPAAVRIVAEGDSWFQYPFKLYDIIDVVAETYAVKCLSGAGDTVADMLRQGEFIEAIAAERPAFFLFSGGGNDLVGDGKFGRLLRSYTPGTKAGDLIDQIAYREILDGVVDGYEKIIIRLEQEFPDLKMVGHSYDIPRKLGVGPWFKPFLDAKRIPLDVGVEIVEFMLDAFGRELDRLAAVHKNFIHLPLFGTVGVELTEWYDALHPNDPGYRRAADKILHLLAELQSAVPRTRIAKRDYREGLGRFTEAPLAITSKSIAEAFSTRAFGFPVAEDFGPESGWIKFPDPLVAGHIRAVIELLARREEAEAAELVGNRFATRPVDALGAEAVAARSPRAMVEALLGNNDLEDVQTLLVGYRASKSVGLIAREVGFGGRTPLGSGFLVAPGLVLTNNHVIGSPEVAENCVLVLDDETSIVGERLQARPFRITGHTFLTDAFLDYTFVSVEPTSSNGAALADYQPFKLFAASGKAIKGEAVSVIQHPGGRPKAIAIRDSYVMGRVKEGFYYTADTEPGSSGSAVLNRDWQIVALHHRTVPHPLVAGEHIANRGIRISSLLEHVAARRRVGEAMAAKVLSMLGLQAEPQRLDQLSPQADLPQSLKEHWSTGYGTAEATTSPTEDGESADDHVSAPDGDEESTLESRRGSIATLSEATEAAAQRLGIADVSWVRNFANNPDYWHLPAAVEGARFALTPALVESAIVAGRYEPFFTADGLLVVAIRGAAIASGNEKAIDAASVDLVEQKPDHRTFRCVIAVYDRPRRRVSAFKASTVPNRGGVVSQYARFNFGQGVNANMLPTGCYELCVGTHNGSATVPNVLRLGTGPDPNTALRVTTLRTVNDCIYGTSDVWDPCRPMDNIHPAFSASSAEFSSLGCLTVPGRYNGGPSGLWAEFQEAGKFAAGARGRRYNLLLTTGMELAALNSAGETATSTLARLSHGSTGAEVTALQTVLGLAASGTFDADTKWALTKREQTKLGGKATGIYSARLEAEIGFRIFGAPLAHEEDDIDSDENQLEPRPAHADPGLAVRTTPLDFSFETINGKIFAKTVTRERFYIGYSVGYTDDMARRGLAQKIGDLGGAARFDAATAAGRFGNWAHLLAPTIEGESDGYFGRVNSYDRAAFTFGCYQFAAHTPEENLVLLFRKLLGLPTAGMYLPDLMLKERADGQRTVHLLETGGHLKDLEAASNVTRPNGAVERQIPLFMAYLNSMPTTIDDAERRAAARLMLWVEEEEAARDAQIELAVETANKKLKLAQTKVSGLVYDDWRIAVWVNDILHQGRGTFRAIGTAFRSSDPLDALSRIGSSRYNSRKSTVKAAIRRIEASGSLAGWKPI